MQRRIKLLIFVKRIDGGTGTNVISLQNLPAVFNQDKLVIKTLVLEEPAYRQVKKERFVFFHPANTYDRQYKFSERNVWLLLREFIWFKREVQVWQPDVILSIDVHCNLIALLYKRLFCPQQKIIATTQINLAPTLRAKSPKLLNFLLRKAVSFFYNQADKLVGGSKGVVRSLVKDFNLQRQPEVVYNGLSWRPLPPPRQLRRGRKVILTIGRLVEQKDHQTLLKAFQLLQTKLPASQLWLVSDGPLKDELAKRVAKLRLTDKVKFWGWVEDIYTYLEQADVFVLASRREGFAYVLLEAMAAGLPIISTDTAYGPAEVLGRGRYGLLVPVGDAAALSVALYKVLTNKQLYAQYSQRSRTRVKFFTEEKMLKGYKRVVQKIYP